MRAPQDDGEQTSSLLLATRSAPESCRRRHQEPSPLAIDFAGGGGRLVTIIAAHERNAGTSSSLRGVKRRSNPGAACVKRWIASLTLAMTEETKRKRNAERRRLPTTAPCGAALLLRQQRAFRRSTAVLARGTLVPKAQRQAMLPGTWPERSILCARPNRGAETLRRSTGITRAAPVPVQRSTSRTGHSAGRLMPEPPGKVMAKWRRSNS